VDDFRERANAVRDIPLDLVLILRGAVRDRRDRAKWHTERGPVSVTGCQFMNWQLECGGGGAIDLVMQLASVEFGEAIEWLERHVGSGYVQSSTGPRLSNSMSRRSRPSLELPMRNDAMLGRVREYLTGRRKLAPELLDPLIEGGKLYADGRANAVLVMVAGKPNRPVGAELRGTGPRGWRGMATGSAKDLGFFWIGPANSQQIVLCESAIDAISCFQLHRENICISTAGVRTNPPWLVTLIARGYDIRCGFDADHAGEMSAARMMAIHPTIRRRRPPAHDWNDALVTPR
jgi:hypothetical protein